MKNITLDGVSYTLTDDAIEVDGYTLDENTTCNACYGEIEDGAQLTIAQHINIENEQKLAYGIIDMHCANDAEAEMFLSTTDQYYDWTSKTTKMNEAMYEARDDEDKMSKIENDYMDKASKLTHHSRDVMDEARQHVADARENAEYYR